MLPRLLYITTNLQGPGGVSRVLLVKLNYLIETYGYTVHVVTTNNLSDVFFYECNNNIVFHKIDIQNFGFNHLLKYKIELKSIVDNLHPNIIINCDNGLKGALLPYLIKTNACLIYEMHGSKTMVFDKWFDRLKFKLSNYISQKSIRRYKCIVVLTNDHTKEWSGKNIIDIPNPITISYSGLKKNKEKIALAVGRFSIEKGYERLLLIWTKVSRFYPDWKLKIYGSGIKNKYYALLQKLDIETSVELNDATKNIQEVYSNSSILLNTSFSEAMPLTMIEAMHYGLTVIAYKTIGAEQLIKNGENGYLIAQDDELEFVEKLKDLMNNNEKLELMSRKSIGSVEKYNLEIVMKQWHELFQSLYY